MKCEYVNNNEQCDRDAVDGKKMCCFHNYSLLPIAKSCKTQCYKIDPKSDERCVFEKYKDLKFCKNHKHCVAYSDSESDSESESESEDEDVKYCDYKFKKGEHKGEECGARITDHRRKYCSKHSPKV
jgi:hypothetical protein